ncbi:hypothetical protein Sp245p_25890 (plasmid) [Azospirillum baldaniorum]|uniref:Uncharacterized protein n=1 Tax=Azospirillum baldaniorum TaxID=1064539 RepID=A0A9P1JZS4_9PROT|nr:hypothetical protein [Azospirillum baldaniorum]AWJ93258.1 hypothetical protein Sp245p_25890 [Azospirillum baldaniorum]TWA77952.1 hypothetical protein FBZ85_106112 [Azospirillum brasilense]CCD02948.1 protein of unknown function [Azospirillum baldaniorum]
MTDLTYVLPEPPEYPFRVGDEVETVNRNGEAMGRQHITRIKGKIVTTDCGRRWTKDGWWHGETRAYPFPSIRHPATPSA